MLVALECPRNGWIVVSDDDGATAALTLAEWRSVLRLPTGQQRAAVERIVEERTSAMEVNE